MGNSRKQPNILKTAIVFLLAAAIVLLVVIMIKSGIDKSRVEPDPTGDIMAGTDSAYETGSVDVTGVPEVTNPAETDQGDSETPTPFTPANTPAPAVTATPAM